MGYTFFLFYFFKLPVKIDAFDLRTQRSIPKQVCETKGANYRRHSTMNLFAGYMHLRV